MLKKCPRCQQRYNYNPQTDNDFVHKCNSQQKVKDEEDVFVLGDYIDERTAQRVTVSNALMKGQGNAFWGQDAWIEGEDYDGVTKRGKNKKTHRQRQHYEYINGG